MAKIVTHEMFLESIKKSKNKNLEILGKYVNAKTKIPVRCKKCGKQWEKIPLGIKNGQGCMDCRIKNSIKTNNEFTKEVKMIWGDKYIVLDVYKNSKEKVVCKCSECGNEFKISPVKLISKDRPRGCPNCKSKKTADRCRKELSVFKNEIGNDFEVLTEYKNARSKIIIKHLKCGRKFETLPDGFLKSKLCKYCGKSLGEDKIRKFLEKNGVEFIEQYKINECRDKMPLPFDFFLPKEKILIEYDGIQHFKKIPFFDGKYGYDYIKKHDEIKNNYCSENDLELIRIRYDEDVIERLKELF
ncbi:hypothetical protein SPSF3K_01499 [Streptococcus parauberis]|uniref:Treble clef zinc finger domain-containing protein n=1 Tax=Streptococcus parauberis KRS-02083 TaxID=1207545 RepID=A0ABN0ISE0_9STRE|nr:hypothetical protein [Streptococcus parauberis]QBX17993.1 hypothetical protein Javan389_0034 [Streptococcus phage Javan389]QBX27494.1 hypothetical protein Javan392_0038 [Streptococcus phage Javan392]AUT06224.1 hypothetical protein SPSF3K_01499 [Streptococcus parauberis]EMG25771.1 hypothetical protein SPJ1_1182 [Streptococcus parauberis KRS-02083]UWV09617.1 hypothetical protein N2A95_07500 [Streptococcus parauberis]